MICYQMLSLLYMGIVMVEIVITEWALQSYLNLARAFTPEEYKKVLRPDAELLSQYPNHVRFRNDKFWGPCKDKSGSIIRQGYKMKWHNMGSGQAQLRLLVVIAYDTAYLCNAYVKDNEKTDFREMAKLKTKIQQINAGEYTHRGNL